METGNEEKEVMNEEWNGERDWKNLAPKEEEDGRRCSFGLVKMAQKLPTSQPTSQPAYYLLCWLFQREVSIMYMSGWRSRTSEVLLCLLLSPTFSSPLFFLSTY